MRLTRAAGLGAALAATATLMPALAAAHPAGRAATPLASGAPVVSSIAPTTGPSSGGTNVLIRGEDLSGVSTVYFGTTAVNLKKASRSAASVKVKSPAGSGVVDVTVESSAGHSEAAPADEFSYAPVPPTVTKVSPASGRAAQQRPVHIAGTNFIGATEVHFGTISVPFKVEKATKISTQAPIATVLGPVDVTVTTPQGTSELSPHDLFTFDSELPRAESSSREGPAGGGAIVKVSGEGLLEASAVHFGNAAGEVLEVINDAEIRVISPPHVAERVPITVTTPQGTSEAFCSGARCAPIAKYDYIPTFSSIAPGSGPLEGGTPVTVEGAGFSTKPGGTIILIGVREATDVQCASIYSCTALTPPGKHDGTTESVQVRVPTNYNSKESVTEESEAAQFTYE